MGYNSKTGAWESDDQSQDQNQQDQYQYNDQYANTETQDKSQNQNQDQTDYGTETQNQDQEQVNNQNNVGTGKGTVNNESEEQKNQQTQYKNYDRTEFRDLWMSEGSNYHGDVMAFIKAHGWDPSLFAQVSATNGAWRLPSGEVIDMVIDYGGKNQAAWTGAGQQDTIGGKIHQYDDSNKTTDTTTTTTDANKTVQKGTTVTDTFGVDEAEKAKAEEEKAKAQALRDKLYQQLLDRATQGTKIDKNDAIIRAQADAYNATTDRSTRNYLADLAEQAGPNTNLRGEQRMAAEKSGQAEAGFEAELMGRELQARREEIQNALTEMGSLLTADQQAALQKELAVMDNALKKLALDQNNDQFLKDLDYRKQQLAQQNQQYQGDLDYRNRQLQAQTDQFLERLGFDATDRAAYWAAVNKGLLK